MLWRQFDYGDAVSGYEANGRVCRGKVIDVGLLDVVIKTDDGQRKSIYRAVACNCHQFDLFASQPELLDDWVGSPAHQRALEMLAERELAETTNGFERPFAPGDRFLLPEEYNGETLWVEAVVVGPGKIRWSGSLSNGITVSSGGPITARVKAKAKPLPPTVTS